MTITLHGRLTLLGPIGPKVTADFNDSAVVFTGSDGTTAIRYSDVRHVEHAIGGRWLNGKLHLVLTDGRTMRLDDIQPDPDLRYSRDRLAQPLIREAAEQVAAYMQSM